jgi:hypothetical protein
MRFDNFDRLERINIAIRQLNEADLTFSATRRNFTMPSVRGGSAVPSEADILAGERMRVAGAGGRIPKEYSESERQKQIEKIRSTPTKSAPKEEKKQDQQGENWVDKAQEIADIATLAGSFVPVLNVPSSIVQAVSGAIDFYQGQKTEGGLRGAQAALGALPGGRLLSTAGGKVAARGAVLAGEKAAAEEALRLAVPAGRRRAQSALTAIERQIADLPPTTGLKAKIPTWSSVSDDVTKAAFKQAGAKYIPTTAAKYIGGLGLRAPSALMGGQAAVGGEAEQPDTERAAPSGVPGQETPAKPKHKQVEFEGQMWDENLARELQRQRKRDAAVKAEKLRTTMRTPPRKSSGEVDIEAWHTMTGMKIPKTYDETKRAIEVTKPYGYDPLEVDPALRSRYEKVKQQVQQNM